MPIMLIDKHIGADENGANGIMGDVFLRELLALENAGKTKVEIWINSVGGVVLDGWSIYGGIRNSKMEVTTVNIGIAASTAGWLFEAGHNRVMMDYSVIMMHMPHGGGDNGQDEISNSIATMLSEKSNKTIDEILNLMEETTFMSADEAYNIGLCDEVRSTIRIPEMSEFVRYTNQIDKWTAGEKIKNQLLPKNNKMEQVKNMLGLNPEANEAAVVAEIAKLQNSYLEHTKNKPTNDDMADDDMDDKKNGMNDDDYASLQRKYDELQAQYNDMNDKYNEMMKAKNEAENAAKMAACNRLASEYAELGAIENTADVISTWAATANSIGIEEAKKLLETLPINRVSPVTNMAQQAQTVASAVPTNVTEYKNKFKTIK